MNEFRLITHPLRNLAELDAQLYTEKSAYLRSRPEPKPGIGTYTKFRTLPPSRHDGVNRVCLVRKSDFLVSILLFLVRKRHFLVSILLFLVGKADFLVSILLFLVGKAISSRAFCFSSSGKAISSRAFRFSSSGKAISS